MGVDERPELGAMIRDARIAAGLTQQELAAQCGMTHVQISRIECGKHRPRILTLRRIVGPLGLKPAVLRAGSATAAERIKAYEAVLKQIAEQRCRCFGTPRAFRPCMHCRAAEVLEVYQR